VHRDAVRLHRPVPDPRRRALIGLHLSTARSLARACCCGCRGWFCLFVWASEQCGEGSRPLEMHSSNATCGNETEAHQGKMENPVQLLRTHAWIHMCLSDEQMMLRQVSWNIFCLASNHNARAHGSCNLCYAIHGKHSLGVMCQFDIFCVLKWKRKKRITRLDSIRKVKMKAKLHVLIYFEKTQNSYLKFCLFKSWMYQWCILKCVKFQFKLLPLSINRRLRFVQI
jgi:hypothetical protein